MWLAAVGTATGWATVYLRLALAAGFLTAVTDRFGVWGSPGAPNVSWGDFQRFTAYTGVLNPWAPAALIPPLAGLVTFAETVLACALIAGIGTRYAALASGVLLALFALGMTMGTGLKSALNYSVFAASAGAFALATAESYRWSLDALRVSAARRQPGALGVAPQWTPGPAGSDPVPSCEHEPMGPVGRDRGASAGREARRWLDLG